MPFVMRMDWPGVTSEQYDELRGIVRWETDKPDGALLHVAAFDDEGIHVTDMWDSPEQFQRFADERLMPAVDKVGVEGGPQISILPAHAVFAPGFE